MSKPTVKEFAPIEFTTVDEQQALGVNYATVVSVDTVRTMVIPVLDSMLDALTGSPKGVGKNALAAARGMLMAFAAADGHQQPSGVVFRDDQIKFAAACGFDLRALEQLGIILKRPGNVDAIDHDRAKSAFLMATRPMYKAGHQPILGTRIELAIV